MSWNIFYGDMYQKWGEHCSGRSVFLISAHCTFECLLFLFSAMQRAGTAWAAWLNLIYILSVQPELHDLPQRIDRQFHLNAVTLSKLWRVHCYIGTNSYIISHIWLHITVVSSCYNQLWPNAIIFFINVPADTSITPISWSTTSCLFGNYS